MKSVDLQKNLLAELAIVLGYEVGLDDELLVEDGLDSFGIMQMVAYLEESYGFMIPLEYIATANFASARIISDWVLPLGEELTT